MVKILQHAISATYRTSIMPNSEGRIRQLSDLIVRMFAMNSITFRHLDGNSGLCHFAFIIQDWQQSLKWLNEKRKAKKKSEIQSQITSPSEIVNQCL